MTIWTTRMPFAKSDGLELYFELHGQGETLVLLNGALDTIEADWSKHLPAFAQRYRILAYDHRGHGRTSRSAKPFSGYDLLVDDLESLLDIVGIERAHFCGLQRGWVTTLL